MTMNIALTNYGQRCAGELSRSPEASLPIGNAGHSDAACHVLACRLTEVLLPYKDTPAHNWLLAQGLIEQVPLAVGQAETALRYRRNPLEHIESIIFEFTTRCNFNCGHCYNARVERVTETDVAALKAAADVAIRMGVRRFAFIGGEVSRYGDGWLDLAERIYDFAPPVGAVDRVTTLVNDRTNTLSRFIDIGNGAQTGAGKIRLADIPDDMLYCKGFFRPAPRLTLKANGEVATCRVTNAGEGYGNLPQQALVTILNRMQDSLVFKLHAERRLAAYRRCVDPAVFGESFAHLCTVRAILTLIARRIEEEAVAPDDQAAILRINHEVARYTGHR